MKKIKLRSNILLIGDAKNAELIEKEAKIFDENKIEVLNTFNSIEYYIIQLIRYEFLGPYDHSRKEEFENFNSKIGHTSWFNFNEKRKMTVDILTHNLTDTKKKEEIAQIFKRIMSLRNAIAHGHFNTDGNISTLEYYEGELQVKELNDEYWSKVDFNFTRGYNILNKHLKEKGILK